MSVASEEQWRPIPGYERTYQVSDQGRVRSLPRPRTRGGILTRRLDKHGYWIVTLSQDGQAATQFVHRLVAAAFLGPCPEGEEVRHLDGVRTNAEMRNLAYGTRRDNEDDKRCHGTHHNVVKTHCPDGHRYDDENTYVEPSRPNSRHCRTCRRARNPANCAARRARLSAA
jgi:hypothetical protein